ncbi:MAG TPA: flagellar hook-basal body complex protein FliE [Syntrophales bacterium]|nr:flagellar hook-basal body complex protein FliE [Syntrophales bacterium]
MSDVTIRGDALQPSTGVGKGRDISQKGESEFFAILKDKVNEINQLQLDADQAITKVEMGTSGSIHDAVIALEKADLSFRKMIQVRNKILEAYQEVMRMQV